MGTYLNMVDLRQAVAIWMGKITTNQFKLRLKPILNFHLNVPRLLGQVLGNAAQPPVIMSISLPFFNWIREFPLIFHSCGIWGWASAAVFFTILSTWDQMEPADDALSTQKGSSSIPQGTLKGPMLTRTLDLASYLFASPAKLLKQGLASHLPVDTNCYWHGCWNPPNISPSPMPSQVRASGKPHSFVRQQGRSCVWRHRQISLLQAGKKHTESPHPISSPKQALPIEPFATKMKL